jgi:hypothetical protein
MPLTDPLDWRKMAAHLRMLVEREEGQRGDGYGRLSDWPELKAALLDLAVEFDKLAVSPGLGANPDSGELAL